MGGPEHGIEPRRARRALTVSMVDGGLYAVMIGVSESYLGALAVELGHGAMALALLATVPLLVGAIAQLATGWLVGLVRSRKRVVVAGAALQALCHVGFVAVAATGDRRLWPLLATKCGFWIAGSVVSPAWNAWMGVLTEGMRRERYFAWRSTVVYLVLLPSYIGGGLWLEHGRGGGDVLAAFGGLFVVATVARLGGVCALVAQARAGDPPAPSEAGPLATLAAAVRGAQWQVALYLAGVMFGAHLAAPFFTPYMLRELGLDLTTYALLTAVSIPTKALAFPLYSRLAARHGLRAALLVGGAGVALVPVLWSAVTSVPWLMAVEAFSGVAWAGMEFAGFQLLLGATDDRYRVEFFSIAGALTATAQVAGSLVGGQLLTHGVLGYTQVFLASGVIRAIALLMLWPPVLALARRSTLPRLLLRVVSLRAVAGVQRHPVLPDPAEVPVPTPPGAEG